MNSARSPVESEVKGRGNSAGVVLGLGKKMVLFLLTLCSILLYLANFLLSLLLHSLQAHSGLTARASGKLPCTPPGPCIFYWAPEIGSADTVSQRIRQLLVASGGETTSPHQCNVLTRVKFNQAPAGCSPHPPMHALEHFGSSLNTNKHENENFSL